MTQGGVSFLALARTHAESIIYFGYVSKLEENQHILDKLVHNKQHTLKTLGLLFEKENKKLHAHFRVHSYFRKGKIVLENLYAMQTEKTNKNGFAFKRFLNPF